MANYDSQFPVELSERPLRFENSETNPAKLMREELARVYRQQQEITDRLLVSMAQTRFQLARVHRDLQTEGSEPNCGSLIEAAEIIGENLQEVLDEHAVRAEDLTDQPWTVEKRSDVDVRGQDIREDIDQPRVAYMELPVVYRRDRLIAKGAAIIEAPKRD